MNIYVGSLAYEVTDESLKTAFQAHGTVESAKVVMDRYTGRSKGFGFVEMPNRDQALAAIETLNDTELSGRKIVVNESRPKTQRNDRHGGFGDSGRRYSGGFGGGNRRS